MPSENGIKASAACYHDGEMPSNFNSNGVEQQRWLGAAHQWTQRCISICLPTHANCFGDRPFRFSGPQLSRPNLTEKPPFVNANSKISMVFIGMRFEDALPMGVRFLLKAYSSAGGTNPRALAAQTGDELDVRQLHEHETGSCSREMNSIEANGLPLTA